MLEYTAKSTIAHFSIKYRILGENLVVRQPRIRISRQLKGVKVYTTFISHHKEKFA